MALYLPPLRGPHALVSVRPYSISLSSSAIREGLLIQTPTKWVEIAPLTGRSKETLTEAYQDVIAYLYQGKTEGLCASAQFGLESLATPRHFPLTLPLCPLLEGTPERMLLQAQRTASKGCRIAKIKISSLPLHVIPELIDRLSTFFPLRIDCNLFFSYDAITHLLASCKAPRIAYIEDPTYEMHKLHAFSFPLALDEPLTGGLPEPYPTLCALVLKPTLLGGWRGCLPLIEYAHKHHLKVIWSSAMESSIGLMQIAHMAQHLGLDQEPLGLDTMQFFQTDLISPSIDWSAPALHLTEEIHGPTTLPVI